MGQFYNLLVAVRAFTDANTTDNYITVLNALPTFAWNADGSAGAADSTPNNAHPISAANLNLAANDILGGLYMLADFVSFMGGAAVPTVNRVPVAEKLMN